MQQSCPLERPSVSDLVRDRLCELLYEHGRGVCSTPNSLRLLLRQACPNGGDDIDDLVRSLGVPVVREMLAKPVESADESAVVAGLITAGISNDRARRTAETWFAALDKERFDGPTVTKDWNLWNQLDVTADTAGGSGTYQRSIWHLVIVASCGLAGGVGAAIGIFRNGSKGLIEPWRDAFAGLSFAAAVMSVAVLGALGGAAGGVVGWALGGGRSWTYDAWGGTSLGRLSMSGFGAFNGAAVGVLGSLGYFGLYGVLPFALLGALIGSFVGLFAAERISRFL